MRNKTISLVARKQEATVQARARGGYTAAVMALLLAACSSSNDGLPPKSFDGSTDKAPDTKRDTSSTGCTVDGQLYSVGQVYAIAGTALSCPQTCVCQATGPSCLAACLDAGVTPDTPPGVDGPAPVTCSRGGRSYNPGETVQLNDGCGSWGMCGANGNFIYVYLCPDAGPDVPMGTEVGPDAPADKAQDKPIGLEAGGEAGLEVGHVDVTCTSGAPCNLDNGGKGLCSGGICRSCSGPQQDNACAAVYGAGTLCADNQCVTGNCHSSTTCTGNKVCGTNYTCQNCASDLQCQNDTAYGRGTICLSNGQCVAGTCHTSTDCQGKKLCDASAHTCSSCTTDTQCQADTVYGAKSICVSSQCIDGTCATSNDCKAAGRLCPSSGTKVCAACQTDAQCKADAAYGASTICVEGQCVSGACTDSSQCANGRICNTTSHVCVACTTDTQCKNDSNYGQHTICLSSACTTGDCHDISSDCSAGRICGSSVPHACGDCSTDTQCRQDARYGTGFICVGNLCVRGDCHDTSNDCTQAKAGLVCGAVTAHTCGACSSDDQCHNDPVYGANRICNTTTGSASKGDCVSNACTNNNHACTANAADFCCSNTCVAGNCCVDADCDNNPQFGPTYFCRQNSCTKCDIVTGANYLVDPVNGDDSMATGSGTAGGGTATAGCAFRTVTRALAAIGSTATAKTITIIGSSTSTPVSLHTTGTAPVEDAPITIPANVTVTTQTGPVKLTVAGGKVGFKLTGDGAKLGGAGASTLLTIDGSNNTSLSGIVVDAAGGTVTLSNLAVTKTGDDGIQVSAGTVQIGAGVSVTAAGTTASGSRQNGLYVSGGTVTISNTNADAPTLFSNNTQSGIFVTGTGVLNITGSNTDTAHSVQTQGNDMSNVDFQPTAVATASVINGLYSATSGTGDGLRILAGTNIRVRNSTFGANAGNGIHIAPAATGTTNLLTNIDLGQNAGAQAGHNRLQTALNNNANAGAGLCVNLGVDAGATALRAAGNIFVTHDCSAASPGDIRVSATCTGATDLGTTAGTTADVNTDNCTQP